MEAFMKVLKIYRGQLSRQEIKTLRGQALGGDIEGARKGLLSILSRRKKWKLSRRSFPNSSPLTTTPERT